MSSLPVPGNMRRPEHFLSFLRRLVVQLRERLEQSRNHKPPSERKCEGEPPDK